MSTDEVLSYIGVSRSTLMQWRAQGKAPIAKQLPNRTLRWHRQDVEAWMDNLPSVA